VPDGLIAAERSEIGQNEQRFDLREALSFFWRQWKFIAAIIALALLIGLVLVLRQTPLYTATNQVLLERQHEVPPGGDAISSGDTRLDLPMIESQMSIIRSTIFLRRVVEKEGLAPAAQATAAEATLAAGPQSFFQRVTAFFSSLVGEEESQTSTAAPPEVPGAEAGSIPPAEMRAIEALKGSLTVSRAAQLSYVLSISITSPNPVRAARLANAVADAYLVDKLDTRFEAAKRSSAWLSDRLVNLRQQVHDAEEAVAQFRADHGLVQSNNGTTLNQQQLSDLNAKLIDAKADLAQKKARVDLLNSIQAKGGSVQALPDIANAGALPTLRQQASTLSAQEADLLARYGASHPLVINIRAQLRDVERSIGAETSRLASSVANDYELAQARVASLEKSLQAATGQSNVDDATAIRLRELERTAAVNKTLFEDFLKQSKITQEQSTFEPQEVRVITPAVPPGAPSYPRKGRYFAVSLFFGLLFGIGGAVAKEKLNTGFTTPKQVEETLGLPLLVSITRMTDRDLAVERNRIPIYEMPTAKPLSRFSEAIRSLRSGIHMTDVDHPPKVIQVTSTVPGEGKTTVALSLASSAASAKLRVLLIDADLRHPSATQAFGLTRVPGLVDLLLGEVTVEQAVQFHERGGYWALGAGDKTQNPTDLLGSERMRALIAGFKEAYDLVIVDTPPAGPLVDPVVISHLVDKIVLVVRWGATARELVKDCVIQLSGHRKVAGVAFNHVDEREAQKYGKYAYSYYYGRRYYKRYYTQ
jgi:succinoglycan biosynthesis transport protein ExoP